MKQRKFLIILMFILVFTLSLTSNKTFAASPSGTGNIGTRYTIPYNQGNADVTFFYPSVVYRENTHTLPVHINLTDAVGSTSKVNYVKEILVEERPLVPGTPGIQRWIEVKNIYNDNYLETSETSKTLNLYIDIPTSGSSATVKIFGMRYNFGITTPETFPEYSNYTMQLTFNTPIELTVDVVDGETNPPVITGNHIYEGDVNNPPTLEELKASLTATDDEDGDLSEDITVHYEDYLGNEMTVGNRNVHFIVYDSAGNSDYFEMIVRINDFEVPTLTLRGSETVYHEVGSNYSDQGVIFNDNYDPSRTIFLNNIVDEDTLGTYNLTYTASDDSGNTAEAVTRTVIVRDTTDPFVIDNIRNISTYDSFNESIDDLLSDIRVYDNYDGDITETMTIETDNYSSNMDTPGFYSVIIQASDSSGNQLSHTITIEVKEDESPVFTFTSRFIELSEYTLMTIEDIKVFIRNLN